MGACVLPAGKAFTFTSASRVVTFAGLSVRLPSANRFPFLQYLNGKAAYVENIWTVINWKTAEERFLGTRGDAFKVLKASI